MSFRPIGLLLALLYAVGFLTLRDWSVDQWYLPAGLRVAALLLFPFRYWPYLIAGETGGLLYLRYGAIERNGLDWYLVSTTTVMPMVAAIVYLHRPRFTMLREYWFLSVAVAVAISVTALNVLTIELFMPPTASTGQWERSIKYIIGDYLGILMLAPLALLWQQRKLSHPSRKLRWDAVVALTVIAGLTVLVHSTRDDPLQSNSARVLMMLPAILLTCLHGWRGAAIGISAVNLAIGLTLIKTRQLGSHDPDTFIVQQMLAMAGTAMLAFGTAISLYYRKFWDASLTQLRAQALIKSSVLAGERDLQDRATRIEVIGEEIDASLRQAVQSLRERGHHNAAMDLLRNSVTQSQLLREQLRLARPSGIKQFGLYVELQSGPIALAWDQSGRVAPPYLTGDPCQLGLDLQLAAYRCIHDAVNLLLELEAGTVLIRAHSGKRGDLRGIAVNVSLLDPSTPLSAETAVRALDALAGRALAYGGTVRCRRNSIRIVLSEPAKTSASCGQGAVSSTAHITPFAPL